MRVSSSCGCSPSGLNDYTENPKDGSVDLTCLDDRYLLNGAPTLPAVAASSTGTQTIHGKTFTYGGNAQLTALWPMRNLLAQAGIFNSPPPRPQCILYASMHGSAWPEVSTGIGRNDFGIGIPASPASVFADVGLMAADGSQPETVAGFWSPQVVGCDPAGTGNTVSASGGTSVSLTTTWGTLHGEAWVLIPTAAPPSPSNQLAQWGLTMQGTVRGDDMNLSVVGQASALGARFDCWRGTNDTPGSGSQTTFTSSTVATTAGWHQVNVYANYIDATHAQVTWWLDGVQQSTSTVTVPVIGSSFTTSWWDANQSTFKTWTPVDTMQLTLEPAVPAPTAGFSPSAVLDASLTGSRQRSTSHRRTCGR